MQSKVSVIIPNFNGLVYLKQSLPMILDFSYKNLEIIVVDNGSTDDSITFLKKIKDKRFKFLESPVKESKNFACNYGVKNCSGDYLLMFDNDILINDRNLLSNLIKRYKDLSKRSKVGLIGLSFRDLGKNKTKSYGTQLGLYFTKEQKPLNLNEVKKYDNTFTSLPAGAGFFMEKKIWFKVGGYDEYLTYGGDDTDLGIRLWLFGFKNYQYTEKTFLHIGTPERNDNQKFAKKWKLIFYAHLLTILKNYNNYNVLPTLFGYSIFAFLKSIKQTLKRIDFGPIKSYFAGYLLFIANFRIGLQKRKIIQSKRKVKRDTFLKIKLTQNNLI